MSIARGWGKDAHKHNMEDYIRDSSDHFYKSVLRIVKRKEKIKKILDGDKHSR